MLYIEILYNAYYGGFSYSDEFVELYNKTYNANINWFDEYLRYDPKIIEVYKLLGMERSSGVGSKLELIKIPKLLEDSIIINEYDGWESVSVLLDISFSNNVYKAMMNDSCNLETLNKIYNDINSAKNELTNVGIHPNTSSIWNTH